MNLDRRSVLKVGVFGAAALAAETGLSSKSEAAENPRSEKLLLAGFSPEEIRALHDNNISLAQDDRHLVLHAPEFEPSEITLDIDLDVVLSFGFSTSAEFNPIGERPRSNVAVITLKVINRRSDAAHKIVLHRTRAQSTIEK